MSRKPNILFVLFTYTTKRYVQRSSLHELTAPCHPTSRAVHIIFEIPIFAPLCMYMSIIWYKGIHRTVPLIIKYRIEAANLHICWYLIMSIHSFSFHTNRKTLYFSFMIFAYLYKTCVSIFPEFAGLTLHGSCKNAIATLIAVWRVPWNLYVHFEFYVFCVHTYGYRLLIILISNLLNI